MNGGFEIKEKNFLIATFSDIIVFPFNDQVKRLGQSDNNLVICLCTFSLVLSLANVCKFNVSFCL